MKRCIDVLFLGTIFCRGFVLRLTVIMASKTLLELENQVMAMDRLPISIFMIVANSIGAFANLLVVYVFLCRMTKWMRSGRFFVPFLAINDAIVCAAGTTFRVYLNFNFITPKSDLICQSGVFFVNVFIAISSMILLLITIDRFLSFSNNGRKPLTLNKKCVLLVAIVVFSCVSHSPVWIFYGELQFQYIGHMNRDWQNMTFYQCSENHSKADETAAIVLTVFELSLVFCQVIVMAVLYSYIARVIHKGFRRIQFKRKPSSLTQDSISRISSETDDRCSKIDRSATNSQKDLNRFRERLNTMMKRSVSRQSVFIHFRRHRFTYTFMLLTGVFAINLIPSMVIRLLSIVLGEHTFWHQLTYSELQASLIADNSGIFDSAIHPFIYGFLDKKLRKEIKKILKLHK